MKKAALIVLSLIMLFAMSSIAYASISASWENDVLTVTTTDTVGMNMILIDGVDTGKYVGDTSPSQSFSVPADGLTHRVTTVPWFGASGGTATFVAGVAPVPTDAPAEPTAEPTVEPTAEPTVEPTEEPTVEPTAEPTAAPTQEPPTGPLSAAFISYVGTKLTFTASNLYPLPGEAWVDGVSVGTTVYNGTNSVNFYLKAGNHTLVVHGNGESVTIPFTVEAPTTPVISNVS